MNQPYGGERAEMGVNFNHNQLCGICLIKNPSNNGQDRF